MAAAGVLCRDRTRGRFGTERRREGLNDKDAKQAAMDATMRDLTDYFRADEDIDAGEA